MQWRLAKIHLQALSVSACIGVDHAFPVPARQDDALGERLEIDPEPVSVPQAEKKIDRTFKDRGKNVGALREGRRFAEERRPADAAALAHGDAVSHHDHAFAVFDRRLQKDCRFRPDFGDLDHADGGRAGEPVYHCVEAHGIRRVNQHVDARPVRQACHRADHLRVSQMAGQHKAPPAVCLTLIEMRVFGAVHVGQRNIACPGCEFIEGRPAECHEMPERRSPPRFAGQHAGPPCPTEIAHGRMPLLAAGEEEEQHDGRQERQAYAPPEQAVEDNGDPKPRHASALGQACPMAGRVALSRPARGEQNGKTPQHQEEEFRMHARNLNIVPCLEVRIISFRIGDAHRQHDDRHVPPPKPYENFRIESHTPGNIGPGDRLQCRLDGIDAKAAHAVGLAQRQCVDRKPEMRDPPADKARFRDRVIEDRLSRHNRVRLLPCKLDKLRRSGKIVLPVGIHLKHMGEVHARGIIKRGENGSTLARVFAMTETCHALFSIAYFFNTPGDLRRVPVVDDDHRQPFLTKPGNDRIQRRDVIVGGDDSTGAERHHFPVLNEPLATTSSSWR